MSINNTIVTTFDNTQALRSDCRFIKGNFYKKNSQCFYVRDKWVRINSKFIEFDHEKQEYIHIDDCGHLINGIIVYDNGKPIFGKFSPNPTKNVSLLKDDIFTCINKEIIDKSKIIETSAGFVDKDIYSKLPSTHRFISNKLEHNGLRYRYLPLEYNTDRVMDQYFELFNDSYTNSLQQEHILNHSYGVEYETNNGFIPEHLIYDSGLIPLRDGSLRHNGIEPYEYATIPMGGGDALKMTKHHTKLLNRFCEFSGLKESLHFHQGQTDLSKEFVVAYYKTVLLLQDEIFSMFPDYVRHNKFKDKNYCAELPSFDYLKENYLANCGIYSKKLNNIDELFMYIYYNLSNINILDTVSSATKDDLFLNSHPSDPNGRSKWYIKKRYYVCNFVSLLFNSKRTIEWRLHTPTFNYKKIKAFMLILDAITTYVENNKSSLIKTKSLSLKSILFEQYNSELAYKLCDYIDYRRKNFTKYESNSDSIKSIEFDTDKEFNFNI